MKYTEFRATCPFEIGDKIRILPQNYFSGFMQERREAVLAATKEYTITDIMLIHLLKTEEVLFAYELNNSGKYIKLSRIAAGVGFVQ